MSTQIVDDAVTRIAHLEVDKLVLVEALKTARQFIVVACGDKAPYVRLALSHIDAALAKTEGAHD